MKKGFDRLKGAAVASVMSVGLLGAGSGRAAPFTIGTSSSSRLHIIRSLASTVSGSSVFAAFLSVGGSVTTTSTTTLTTGGSTTFTTITSIGTFNINELLVQTSSAFSTSPSTFYSDAFDGVLGMRVAGTVFRNPDTTIDLTGDVVTSDVVVDIIAGIDAQIEYSFVASRGASSLGLVRALYTLTNTTNTDIATTANIFGDLGSDGGTTIQDSSSGDGVADDADMWTVSNDQNFGIEPSGDPGLVITRYGSNASVIPTQTAVLGAGNDGFANDYNLTIPANSTRRIMVFIEAHKTNAGATTNAADFESLAAADTAGLLTGISAAQQATIVNYGSGGSTGSAENSGGSSSSLSMSSGLLALFGLLPFLRSRRKTKM